MKYFLHPLGCATNKADAERIATMLETVGYSAAESEKDANIIGIVACSIRQSAIDRIYGKVHNWNKRKDAEQLITFVSGCILPADEKKFLKLFDLVVKLDQVPQIPQMLKEYGAVAPQNFWEINPRRNSTFKALIPIQNGCDKFCTYCAVPYTRGREVSRSSADILAEVERVLSEGYKQITLLGQNVNSYGLDKPGEELHFAQLLDAIGTLADNAPQKVWVHYTSPHPRDMTAEVLDVQAKHPSLANYLNLPLQSGNNDVLKRMNRRYTVEHYMEVLDMARSKIPTMTVSTDIIVGFCGETPEQFEKTIEAMERGRYDLAFIAQYSPRPGAVAEKRFEDTVSKEEKVRRDKTLTEVLKRTALENNQRLVGKIIPVLVENASRKSGMMLGRSEGLKSVEFAGDESLIGQFIDMKITQADSWRLYGEKYI
ncbi:MAG: tRNA (N6-isopentenyl adenosine(37)-C2)-methylthiotransferase MiaB [Candidatus Kerfeldbacteria bacterium]|nr:tRNA (N6-isopentenyl adenosine(37)-C2)-methylthiotransferase MiaB [Candidatus Kerfeldbacteria bacterium]